tara:strand:+ start:5044 stop:5817 length:774 start_codon:yes stop_codon:yes gene_type:complete
MNDLFIGGGGYNGFSFIGALEYLHQKNLLEIKNFYGTSIGSLIGLMYISGTSPKEMINIFQKLNLEEIIKYDFSNISKKSCILEDDFLDNLINNVTSKFNETITISEFSDRTNVDINIYTTCITTNEYICMNSKNYGNVKIKDAVKASMSIPFIFKPVEIDNKIYVDGCCKNLLGSPPREIYIRGYSIISSTKHENSLYPSDVMYSIFNIEMPNSTFVINIDNIFQPGKYLSLDKINSKFIIELYKKGIEAARESLP